MADGCSRFQKETVARVEKVAGRATAMMLRAIMNALNIN